MACQKIGTNYECEVGKEITFSSPPDTTNPLTAHVWTIDGIEESTEAQFKKTYASSGSHAVVHSGQNACLGTCSNTVQLDIKDTITPPPPAKTVPTQTGPSLIAGIVVVTLGVLGIAMMKKKK